MNKNKKYLVALTVWKQMTSEFNEWCKCKYRLKNAHWNQVQAKRKYKKCVKLLKSTDLDEVLWCSQTLQSQISERRGEIRALETRLEKYFKSWKQSEKAFNLLGFSWSRYGEIFDITKKGKPVQVSDTFRRYLRYPEDLEG